MTSKRIELLAKLVTSDRDRVFDLCCDHGQIGLSLSDKINEVVLIDRVGSIIEKLNASDIPRNVTCICQDATKFNYPIKSKDCFIIAGIGGHLLIKILDQIFKHIKEDTELVLSPHSQYEQVWEYLDSKNLIGLEYRSLKEKNIYFEFLKLRFKESAKFKTVPFLDEWSRFQNEEFLEQQIRYFELKSKYEPDKLKWLDFYKSRLYSLKTA